MMFLILLQKETTSLLNMDDEGSYSGGHRLTFVGDVPDSLLCIFCHFPSRDTQLSTCCGYNMCQSCLDNYKQSITLSRKILACPKCCHYDFKAYPNKMSDREIYNLMVVCSNGKAGCKWRGNLNELTIHLEDTCLFEMVECPKGCRLLLQRRDIALHAKSNCSQLVINCPHCLVRGKKHFIEGQHLEECSKAPLSCQNHCGASVSSEDMSEHRKVCPLEVVSCEYNDLGCDTDMARQDVEVHNREFIAKHLNLAKQKLVCSTKELESSKAHLSIAKKRLETLNTTFAYSIEEVLSMIRLLDQINFVQQKKEKSNLLRQLSLRYKSLLLLQDNQVAPVVLKMNDFKRHQKNGNSWFSYTFFTHEHGYKLSLCVEAAGHGAATQKSDFVSVFVCLMQGQYDCHLAWPMEGVIRVCLLDQLYSSKDNDLCYAMTISLPESPLFPVNATLRVSAKNEETSIKTPMGLMSSTMLGSSKFISLEKLTKSSVHQFLKDDCIFFRVEYGRSSDDFASPKSCTYKEPESKPVIQHSYRIPQQKIVEKKELADSVQYRSIMQNSSEDTGASKEVKLQVPKILETATSL